MNESRPVDEVSKSILVDETTDFRVSVGLTVMHKPHIDYRSTEIETAEILHGALLTKVTNYHYDVQGIF